MTTTTKIDVYQIVTDRIIDLLNKGTIPWVQPWKNGILPMNFISKRSYQGINLLLLNSMMFDQNFFLTWDQLKKLGGSVKPNEQGTVVVYWKNKSKESEDAENQPKKRPLLRYYKVFNICQCTGIPNLPENPGADQTELSRPDCESVIASMPTPPTIIVRGKQAYYRPEDDRIVVPTKKNFLTLDSYYSVIFHELIHSTGHKSRLSRKGIIEKAEFGSISYAMEELIAEIGSCYLCNTTGILNHQIENSAAYIENWLEKLRNDKFFVLHAASQAQKATDYILNIEKKVKKQPAEEAGPF